MAKISQENTTTNNLSKLANDEAEMGEKLGKIGRVFLVFLYNFIG